MKRETCTASVETGTGWAMKIYTVGDYHRVEVTNPEGRMVFARSMCQSLDEIFDSVRTFFVGQKLDHTATALREMCRAELKFSGQAVT